MSKNQNNIKDQRHGYWEHFHDGKLLCKGKYAYGVEVGLWIWYDLTGWENAKRIYWIR